MKGTSLTESIGRTSESRGESAIATGGDSQTASEGPAGQRNDGTESVTVSIKSSAGYEDSEVFTLRGRKAANAFARRVMAVSLRAHDRRDGDAPE